MLVLLDQIGKNGLDVSEELTEEYLRGVLDPEGAETGLRPAGKGSFSAHLQKVSDKVLLTGKAHVEIVGECKRCLTEARVEVPVEFMLSLVRKPTVVELGAPEAEPKGFQDEEGSAASFDMQAVEEEQFAGREIDLAPILREQLLLALPMVLLCREECQGLCSVCGADLNKGECGCDRKPADPRWAALKNIKLT